MTLLIGAWYSLLLFGSLAIKVVYAFVAEVIGSEYPDFVLGLGGVAYGIWV